ncbi:MAG: hypothetical protein RR091_07545, partial [Cloacibacillus sp.]
LKAICDAQSEDFKEAIRSLKKADFLAAIGKRSWCAAQLMAKAWVSMLNENRNGSPEISSYLPSSPKEYAEKSVQLYAAIGAHKRVEVVRKRFI